jgi:hypothetical protein
VVRGLVRVFMSFPEGRQVTVRYAREAAVLGIPVIVDGPANVSVQTLAISTLFRIDVRRLVDAARRDGRIPWALAEELNRRLYDSLQQPAINTFGSLRQRWPWTCWTRLRPATPPGPAGGEGLPAGASERGRIGATASSTWAITT